MAVFGSLSTSGRTVRVSVVPHCAQPWVISSRLPDSAPPLERAGVIAVIVMRCPQQGHGSKKLGRFDRIRLLKDTESLSHARFSPAISGFISARVKENLCNAHKWAAHCGMIRLPRRPAVDVFVFREHCGGKLLSVELAALRQR
jgi:hypothetical protein